ncbi:DUF4466 family protein [Chitinophaga sp. 30R24]|uniref:DUF4466 family protein n=1 Tax=Chitinophaga sp. 30R24 TaxID=3248838 RepID=UPI003B8ECEE6
MTLDLGVADGKTCYISIAGMAAYNATDAAAHAANIDLVYLYPAIANITFKHALVSPAADLEYLPGVTLPANVNRDTKVSKV